MVKKIKFNVIKHTLEFVKPAKTSRNVFKERAIFLVEIMDPITGKRGIGECGPLQFLSIDDVDDYEEKLHHTLAHWTEKTALYDLGLEEYPSIIFGLETALLDFKSSHDQLFRTPFTEGKMKIPVNGLVWMNNTEEMYQEALEKIDQGFDVIKIKVGALDFDEECRLLEKIRKLFLSSKITIRLDANGGFKADEAHLQLKELKKFDIHSIEQPLATQLWDDMAGLVADKIIPIALDEELIYLKKNEDRLKMLQYIRPNYIILKPNLMGGLKSCDQWVQLAQNLGIDWWATSALESNIGLNAIAQWVSQYPIATAQGLGTGALYKNNFDCFLKLERGQMRFSRK